MKHMEALKNLADWAEWRDNTQGDPCRLLECQAGLAAAAKDARTAIASWKLESPEVEAAYRQQARELYADPSDDDIEVDDDCLFSDTRGQGDDGVWVQAWVWVNREQVEGGGGDTVARLCRLCSEPTAHDSADLCDDCDMRNRQPGWRLGGGK